MNQRRHTESSTMNKSLESCLMKYEENDTILDGVYCNWTWDKVLCWPPTRGGTVAKQPCPQLKGVDPTKFAYKRCSIEGRWEGRTIDDFSTPQGWTNYTSCYTLETLELLKKLNIGSGESAKIKLEIAERTRMLEIIGFSVSLAALLISLAIFCHFRSLRNNRTRIHRNLFIAMVIQVVIRLTLYIDQAVIREPAEERGFRRKQGIDTTPILCEAAYVLLEYARTAMFMWMFIEGLYLHNMITVTVFQEQSHFHVYTLVGWGGPVVMTTAWAAATAVHYSDSKSKCWFGYNLTRYFWILEGPRFAVILLNFLFLLNIIRVLVVKLRQTQSSEGEQVKKAVRAAIVLLPLLGITNLLNMTEAPLERAWQFALWSYTTHFLTSFQGLFVAFLYCFLNGEVRVAVTKSVSVYLSRRQYHLNPRRNSAFSGVFMAAENHAPQPMDVTEPPPQPVWCCCARAQAQPDPPTPVPAIPETLV